MMRLFGLDIRRSLVRTKAAVPVTDLSAFSRGWRRIAEAFPGGWQRNLEVSTTNVLTYAAVYACVRLISTGVGKLRIKLDQETSPGIWEETTNPAYSPVLREPNHYQTRNQFLEQWMTSKLIHGNTYVLKERDNRGGQHQGNVVGLYVLDPTRVKVLVADSGDVYYQLQIDTLSGLREAVTVPASEIIHDVMVALYHPLCGVSPITACYLAAMQGLSIQNNSTQLFDRGLQPPGILTVTNPGAIDKEEIERVQRDWNENMRGGGVAVIGADMKYQALSINAVDAQLIEQLKWTAAEVCIAFGVPAHMINVGPAPTYNNIEALNQQFYSECLQAFAEHIEALLDKGLSLAEHLGTEFDLDGLMRMDTASRMDAANKAINGGGMTANESRKQFHGLGPVAGGNAVLSQQQNFSLEALAKRDASADPFGTDKAVTPPALPPANQDEPNPQKALADLFRQDLGLSVAA